MNDQLQKFARDQIKAGLALLPENNQRIFRYMYTPWALNLINQNRKLTDEEMSIPINDLVDKIPEDKLDWAMQQIQNTLLKRNNVNQTD